MTVWNGFGVLVVRNTAVIYNFFKVFFLGLWFSTGFGRYDLYIVVANRVLLTAPTTSIVAAIIITACHLWQFKMYRLLDFHV